jgi:hypothetical protein
MTDQDKTLEVAEERDGSAVVQLPEGEKSPQGTREDFSKDSDDSDDRDEGSEDSSEGVSDSDPDREAIRAARREERQLKKQLQRARQTESTQLINSLKRQNEQMAERLAVLEKRTAGSDMARLDKAIEDGHLKLQYAKMQIKKSTEVADGTGLAEAQEQWYEARRQIEALESLKKKAVSNQEASSVPKAPDPRLKRLASDWMARNDWYDPQGKDMDSQVTVKIDEALTAEGWDPTTEDYWEELDNRLTKYLPHRYNTRNDEKSSSSPRRPRQVVTGSGRESSRSAGGNEFRLSPERVRAIKDAGRWENMEERQKMIRKYMEYDRMNTTRG